MAMRNQVFRLSAPPSVFSGRAPNDGSFPAAGKVRTADKAVYGDWLAQALHLFTFVPESSVSHSRRRCKNTDYSQLKLPAEQRFRQKKEKPGWVNHSGLHFYG